jgi:DNA polymerase (family 10)
MQLAMYGIAPTNRAVSAVHAIIGGGKQQKVSPRELDDGRLMPSTNAKAADLLRRYATTLQLEGVDRFKIKAYRRAADTLESTDKDVAKLVARGESLETLPGVGKAISAKIQEIVTTGRLPQLDRAITKLSPELLELATKPQLDPKQVQRVYKKLGISSLKDLKKRLDSGEIRAVLGSRLEFHIRQGLDDRPRLLHWAARELVRQFQAFLERLPEVTRVDVTGSYRRKQDTIGDINFLVTGKSAASTFKRVADFAGVLSHEKIGRTEMRLALSSGRTLTLRYTPDKEWGLARVVSTGSDAHLRGLKEFLARKRRSLTAKSLGRSAASEDSLYDKAGLAYIEPELREGRGEIECAATGKLPKLVELRDLRGDLHMHTTASDGANTIAEMAEAAKARGYDYIAITDHSQSLKITNGLTPKRLMAQIKAIDKLNARLKGVTILKSAEVDILANGKLDYPASVLKELDLTICSIHSKFALDKRAQTERLMRAMDSRYFNILGHATGRLLLKREGYEIDVEKLIKHARECGCFFEINSSPDRLDLSDEHARLAKNAEVKIAVNTDAHSIRELAFISAGINQARRGWLEETDVLNTYPLPELTRLLRR